MADGGYDVADPCDVDPLFGTLDDFDALLAAAHERGIRVTVDIVPNHFSDQHPWFQAVLAGGPDAPERDLFIIRPGRGADGSEPPNNWPSAFGGPAWSRLPDGEWYLHLFAPEQPDLNWDEPGRPGRVRAHRCGSGSTAAWTASASTSPTRWPRSRACPTSTPEMLEIREGDDPSMRPHADVRCDRDAVHDIHRELRRILDSYPGDRMAVGEAWVADAERLALYVRPDELNLMFNFELVAAALGWRGVPRRHRALARGDGPGRRRLHLGALQPRRHRGRRPATAAGPVGVARARAAALVQLSLPGAVYLYNGDELGLENVDLPDEALQDPTWERSGHTVRGRDGERVPLPWSGDEPPYGFSTASTTWLPMPADWAGVTVAAQAGGPGLDAVAVPVGDRAALVHRRSAVGVAFEWLDAPAGLPGLPPRRRCRCC